MTTTTTTAPGWFDLYDLARETLLITGRWSGEARREGGRLWTFQFVR